MTLSMLQLEELRKAAKTAAIASGQYIQSQFDQHYEKQHKAGGDSLASQVVTAVDLKAQEIILEHLNDSIENYDLGLLTEELEDDRSRIERDYFWCIDPMDGTLPFTERRTGYAVSIALISKAGDPVIGCVYVPDQMSCYTAIKGSGVQLNDQPFAREHKTTSSIHFYMDRSFQSEVYYEQVKALFEEEYTDIPIKYHADFGGVRNAIGVMDSGRGCYFKYPKERNGCGSIWDYAATRLFFEELGLCISNAFGERLHLNNPQTTFMNDQGVLYATDEELVTFIKELRKRIEERRT